MNSEGIARGQIRDRDYIKDSEGRYLRVLGDHHPDGQILSFVRYYPFSMGSRNIQGTLYGYNSFVSKSLAVLKDCPGRIIYSPFQGNTVTTTSAALIEKHYSCQKKVREILNHREQYENHVVGRQLLAFLLDVSNVMDMDEIGITGSFLIDAYHEKSDIDLVCYGENAWKALREYFNRSSFIQKYEDGLAEMLYARRITHMASMDFRTLILQESRKLQGVVRGTGIHINCQPLRAKWDAWMNFSMLTIGDISCIARVVDNRQGMFSPAYYEIVILSFIYCFYNEDSFKEKVTALISYIGEYAQSFEDGDEIYIEGKLVKIENKPNVEYGIEVTPWITEKKSKVVLLR